eukprot:270946_1
MLGQYRNAVFLNLNGWLVMDWLNLHVITIHKRAIRSVWLNGVAINRWWAPQQLVVFRACASLNVQIDFLNILKINGLGILGCKSCNGLGILGCSHWEEYDFLFS